MSNSSQFLGFLVEIEEGGVVRIPPVVLEGAGTEIGDSVEVFSNEGTIFLRGTKEFCTVCGANGNKMQVVNDIKLCPECSEKLYGKK